MAGHCEECRACCTVFEVEEISKPFGVPCQHLGPTPFGPGCTIYPDRPEPCKHFVCLWLDSQRRPILEDRMGEDLRPDVTNVVLGWPWGMERDVLHVYPLPGHSGAWRAGRVAEHLRMVLSRGGRIIVIDGKKRWAIRGDMAFVGTEEEFARMTE